VTGESLITGARNNFSCFFCGISVLFCEICVKPLTLQKALE